MRSLQRRAGIAYSTAVAFGTVKPRFGSETYEAIGGVALLRGRRRLDRPDRLHCRVIRRRLTERRQKDREFARGYEEHYGKPLGASSGGPTKWLWSDGRFHAFPEPTTQTEGA